MNTRQLILEKTLKLMIEKQNSILSIREISGATGITTGGIYHHFSNKEEIYNEITERYYINYYKFNIDELRQIKGNAKEKIHDVMVEIFKEKQTGIEIESIDDEIDYRIILAILTAKGFVHENFQELIQSLLNDLKEFFTEIIEEGQKNRQIRQDFTTENIAETLYIMYMGVQCFWLDFPNEDIDLLFEKNFEMTWQAIECQ